MNGELHIVDDNADHHFLIYKLLKESDLPYSVKFFDSGKMLHQHIQAIVHTGYPENLPALVLLDLNMPGMNGLGLLKFFKQESHASDVQLGDIPIVIMTSDITNSQINQCYQAGANAVVIKPLDFNQMRETVRSICKFWIKSGSESRE